MFTLSLYMEAFGRYAAFYDLLNEGKDYRGEVAYIHALIQASNPQANRLVELGCGTGGHIGWLADLGYSCTGVDMNESMLEIARSKYPRIAFEKQDIRHLDIGENYDVVLALYHVVNYLSTDEELFELTKKLSERLNPGGLFIFDSWHAPAVLHDPPVSREREFASDTMHVKRVSYPTHDIDARVVDVAFNFEVEDVGERHSFEEVHRMHYYTSETVRRAAMINAMDVCVEEQWLTKAPLSESTWYATYVLRKT